MPLNIADAVVAMADAAATMTDMPEFAPGAEIVIHTDDEDTPKDLHLDGGPGLSETDVDEAACGGSTRTVGHRKDRRGKWGVAMTGDANADCPPGLCSECCLSGTADAATPAAAAPGTYMHTMSGYGATVALPTQTT
ncbi:hypothetical protein DFR67_104238 [Williamsia limnetica]|uniref:Uncharacterized protein n=1 Tax=Williamsia limnetica TaxID=882452 RepID=A0A318RKT6_WILLI|nr:hypothetical protein DFR67_104238 [Williamsia limnetica]